MYKFYVDSIWFSIAEFAFVVITIIGAIYILHNLNSKNIIQSKIEIVLSIVIRLLSLLVIFALYALPCILVKSFFIVLIVFAPITLINTFLSSFFGKKYKNCITECQIIKYKYEKELSEKNEIEIKKIKDELSKNGLVYCSKRQLDNILYQMEYNYATLKECPICKSKMENNFYYVAKFYGKQKITRDGVYVANSYSNQVEDAIKYVDKITDFPAYGNSCPQCGYTILWQNVHITNGKNGNIEMKMNIHRKVVIYYKKKQYLILKKGNYVAVI